MSQLRRGYLYGIGAYSLWGFMPLYIKLLHPAGPVEVLAHRVIWSVAVVAVVLFAVRGWRPLWRLVRRPATLGSVALAAGILAVNWGIYIYGVSTDRVVETALGYFINPLVVVLLGVGVLGERLRAAQWTAIGIGGIAVVVLAVNYGRIPYIALTVALSFAAYGLLKKRLGLPAAQGLFVESAVLALPALGYLGWLSWRAESTFAAISPGHTALLVAAGAVTAIPLLFFAGAANRIPLTGMGMLQYITPTLQLACGVLIFREPMPPARLAGFALVWVALTVFTTDGIRHARGHGRTGLLPITVERARRARAVTQPAVAAASAVSHVDLDTDSVRSCLAQIRRHGVSLARLPIGHDDPRALGGEPVDVAASDALRRTRDDNHLSRQPARQRFRPPAAWGLHSRLVSRNVNADLFSATQTPSGTDRSVTRLGDRDSVSRRWAPTTCGDADHP